jgi:sulfatase-like protein
VARIRERAGAGWRQPGLLWNGLHLAALSSFAIAHQYFQQLDHPEDFFFVEHGATSLDVLLFALILILLPPVGLLLAEWVAGLIDRRLRDALHAVFIAGFVGLIVWQAIDQPGVGGSPRLVILGSMMAGMLAGLAYWRFQPVRSYFTVLSPAPLVVLALFLVFSPMRSMVFGGDGSSPKKLSTSGAPVVMLLLEELPATSLMDGRGHIDARRYPNFARLAREGTWYRNAATVADFTQQSVPAMLTGRRASRQELPIAAEHPQNLFTLLGASYRMNVSEFSTDLCTKPACPVQRNAPRGHRLRVLLADTITAVPALPNFLTNRLARRLKPRVGGASPCDLACPDPVAAPRAEPGAKSVEQHLFTTEDVRFERFLESLRPSGGHTLNFLHLNLAHRPWHYLPSGQKYEDGYRKYLPRDAAGYGRWPRGSAAIIGEQRHLLQAEFVDRMLGRTMRKLKRLGLYDRSLIVVAPDEGSPFKPGDESRVLTEQNVEEVADIPVLVKAPRQRRGATSDAHVETLDILPTIAGDLHVRIPWSTAGTPADQVRGRASLTLDRQQGGGKVVIGWRELERRRDAAVRRRLAIFEGGDPFRIAPYGELVGRRVRDLEVTNGAALRGTIDRASRYRSVDPRSRVLPAEVSGDLAGERPRERPLAIALNGRIVATSMSIVRAGDEYYTVVVPSSAFRRGANQVEVFAPQGPSRVRRLAVSR